MNEYFTEPKSFEKRAKVGLDLSDYATKSDLKNAAGVDIYFLIYQYQKKVDLASLKSNVDKLDIDKLDKLEDVPSNSNNLKSKVDKLDVGKLVHVPAD